MKSIRYIFGVLLFSYASVCSAQWVKEANTPGGGRDAACEFSVGTKVYYGGGYAPHMNLFAEFDPAMNTWTKKANLPFAPNSSQWPSDRAFGLSFSIGSKGYLFGGQSFTDTDASDPNGFNTEQASVTNDLWEYDPATDTWTEKSISGQQVPDGRDGAMVFVINGKAYIGAGVSGAGFYLSDFWEYDPVQDKWTQQGDLPSGAIGFPIGFSVGTMGYMVGGGASAETKTAYSYDPSTDSWNTISPFPGTARQAGVGFSIDSLGYVGLGQSQYSTTYSDFFSYDPSTDTWTQVAPNFPDKIGLGWPTAAVVGQAVFIGGGAELPSFNFSNSWYAFSPTNAAVLSIKTLSSLAAYPNPTLDFVNLSLPPNLASASVTVQNSIGATCLTAEISSNERLDLSSLPVGIYNLEITSGEYHSSQRVVKE
jgi:N-acetylneuraminic acid mutarotase